MSSYVTVELPGRNLSASRLATALIKVIINVLRWQWVDSAALTRFMRARHGAVVGCYSRR